MIAHQFSAREKKYKRSQLYEQAPARTKTAANDSQSLPQAGTTFASVGSLPMRCGRVPEFGTDGQRDRGACCSHLSPGFGIIPMMRPRTQPRWHRFVQVRGGISFKVSFRRCQGETSDYCGGLSTANLNFEESESPSAEKVFWTLKSSAPPVAQVTARSACRAHGLCAVR